MSIAAYPKQKRLKESGVTWIGRIPEHWQVKRLRHLTSKIGSGITPPGGALTYVDDGIPLLRSQNVLFGKIELNGAARISDRVHRRMSNSQVRKGDVLLNITGGSIGRCHYVDINEDMNVNQHVCIIRPTGGIISEYLNFLLSSEVGQKQIWFWQQGGGREGLNFEALKDFAFGVPPLHEQHAIAAFLDKKCAKIDEAVRIKEEQIKLLRERRQILIQQAVTRGLNPDAPMKDSGIDWIGQIPEQWEVKKIAHVAKVDAGSTPDRSVSRYWGGDIPWVKTGEVNYQTIMRSEECITSSGLKNSSLRLAPPGTLLVAMYGQGVTRGRVAILGVPATYNQACCGVSFNDCMDANYAQNYFVAAYHFFREGGNETSQMNLSAGYIARMKIVAPQKREQIAIVEHIRGNNKKIDSAISIKENQITALKEYKTALINAAVTGKIKITEDML